MKITGTNSAFFQSLDVISKPPWIQLSIILVNIVWGKLYCIQQMLLYLVILIMEHMSSAAIERNNLYRLSQSIPFTPLPPAGKWTV